MNIQFIPPIYQNRQYSRTQPQYSTISFKSLDKDTVEFSSTSPKKAQSSFKTNKEIFIDNLKGLGFSDKTVQAILSKDLYKEMVKTSEKCFLSMTKEVPNIESEKLRCQYITARAHVSCKYNEDNGKYYFNKKAFDTFNSVYSSHKFLQSLKGVELLDRLIDEHAASDRDLDFIKDNLDDNEHFILYLELMLDTSTFDYVCQKQFKNLKILAQTGYDHDYLLNKFLNMQHPFNRDFDKTMSKMKDFQEQGITSKFLLPALEGNLNYEDTKRLCDFVDEIVQTRDQLQIAGDDASDLELINSFLPAGGSTLRVIDIFGKDNLKKEFFEGTDRVQDYIEIFWQDYDMNELQPLIKLINPTGSTEYKALEARVNALKKELRGISDEFDRQELIKEINKTSKAKNAIVNNSIKDPVEKVNATRIFIGLIDENVDGKEAYKDSDEIIPFLMPKADEEKSIKNAKFNDLVWMNLGINCPDEIKDKFDFTNSKYLSKLFCPNPGFKDNFKSLVEILGKYPKKTVAGALDMLYQNIELKKVFKNFGWDYETWTRFDPNLKLELAVDYDYEKMQQDAITNLEAEFNDVFYSSLSDERKNRIMQALEKGGYNLVEKAEAEYIDDGFFNGTKQVNKLYKGDKPIVFKDLSNIYKLLSMEFCNDKYWNLYNTALESADDGGTFIDHIKNRHEEMKRIRQTKNAGITTIQVQKADMYDIPHALFLGNDACCCTAVGSFNDWSAPNYIKNKMVQAIELKDGDNYVGNTMIFWTYVYADKKPAIYLDNIELKPKYQYNDKIEQGIIDFAKILGEKVGCPDIDIYAGPNRNKLNMKNFEIVDASIQLVGMTGKDYIYVDAVSDKMKSHNNYLQGQFYKLKK